MALPEGLTTRPLVLTDAPAVTAVMAAEELADIGEVAIEEADIVGDWQRPSFDLASSTVGVFDGERLVGYAERSGGGRGDAAVDRAHHGRGIGTFLAGWLQDTARAAGDEAIGVPVPQGSPGDRLLTALGWRVRWTSWVLELPPGAEIPARPLPAGYAVREAAPTEHEAVWTVIEDAFLEWSDRPRQSFADFTAGVMDRPGFAPWNLRVVSDPGRCRRRRGVRGAGLGLRLRGPARRPRGPAQPGTGDRAARRRVRRGPRERGRAVGAQHRLAHRRAGPVRERRHAGHLDLAEPRRRPLTAFCLSIYWANLAG